MNRIDMTITGLNKDPIKNKPYTIQQLQQKSQQTPPPTDWAQSSYRKIMTSGNPWPGRDGKRRKYYLGLWSLLWLHPGTRFWDRHRPQTNLDNLPPPKASEIQLQGLPHTRLYTADARTRERPETEFYTAMVVKTLPASTKRLEEYKQFQDRDPECAKVKAYSLARKENLLLRREKLPVYPWWSVALSRRQCMKKPWLRSTKAMIVAKQLPRHVYGGTKTSPTKFKGAPNVQEA